MSKNVLIGAFIVLLINCIYIKRLIIPTALLLCYLIFMFILMTSELDAYVSQYKSLGFDISTITRVGSWTAAWYGFLDSPFLGNGMGLAGKFLPNYYPEWFYISPESNDWSLASINFGTPVFSNLFRVLFEGGIFGAGCIVYFVISLVRLSNSRSLLSRDNFLLLSGFFLAFMMVDQLTYWPIFVALGLNRSVNDGADFGCVIMEKS